MGWTAVKIECQRGVVAHAVAHRPEFGNQVVEKTLIEIAVAGRFNPDRCPFGERDLGQAVETAAGAILGCQRDRADQKTEGQKTSGQPGRLHDHFLFPKVLIIRMGAYHSP